MFKPDYEEIILNIFTILGLVILVSVLIGFSNRTKMIYNNCCFRYRNRDLQHIVVKWGRKYGFFGKKVYYINYSGLTSGGSFLYTAVVGFNQYFETREACYLEAQKNQSLWSKGKDVLLKNNLERILLDITGDW